MQARRISGGVSMRNAPPEAETQAPQRRRLSRGSDEVQTGQSHPICGTPTEVPVPRNRNFTYFFSGILPVLKYCSISSSVRPFVSGRKNAAVTK